MPLTLRLGGIQVNFDCTIFLMISCLRMPIKSSSVMPRSSIYFRNTLSFIVIVRSNAWRVRSRVISPAMCWKFIGPLISYFEPLMLVTNVDGEGGVGGVGSNRRGTIGLLFSKLFKLLLDEVALIVA